MNSVLVQEPGYKSKTYTNAFSYLGRSFLLDKSNSWLIERKIEGSPLTDLSNTYPLLCCNDWEAFLEDVNDLDNSRVSVTIVTDPFMDVERSDLENVFTDKFLHFKNHYIVDLSQNFDSSISKHHRYYAQYALKKMRVERIDQHLDYFDHWLELYSNLIKRHNITGMQAFSAESFKEQFNTPGFHLFAAYNDDVLYGLQIWFQDDEKTYSHLSAYTNEGYSMRASYAMIWSILQYFRSKGVIWADLGGGAGLNKKESGLTQFKKGWSDITRPVYLCGKILNKNMYTSLSALSQTQDSLYFPKYRDIYLNKKSHG